MARDRVLAAADLSPSGDEAIRQAHAWALRRDEELHVLHVAPRLARSNMLFPQAQAPESFEQARFEGRIAEEVRRRVAAITGRLDGDFEVVIAEGAPDEEILRAAERLGACLIVVGGEAPAHGRRGDVADHIVRWARVPVLVARARPSGRRGPILAATDFSALGEAAVEAAAEEARLERARLTLVTDIQPKVKLAEWMVTFGTMDDFVSEEAAAARADAERRLGELLRRLEVDGDARVAEGKSADAIVQAARDVGAELVVLGTTPPRGFRHLRGTLGERVARSAPCSVLAVRAR